MQYTSVHTKELSLITSVLGNYEYNIEQRGGHTLLD